MNAERLAQLMGAGYVDGMSIADVTPHCLDRVEVQCSRCRGLSTQTVVLNSDEGEVVRILSLPIGASAHIRGPFCSFVCSYCSDAYSTLSDADRAHYDTLYGPLSARFPRSMNPGIPSAFIAGPTVKGYGECNSRGY